MPYCPAFGGVVQVQAVAVGTVVVRPAVVVPGGDVQAVEQGRGADKATERDVAGRA